MKKKPGMAITSTWEMLPIVATQNVVDHARSCSDLTGNGNLLHRTDGTEAQYLKGLLLRYGGPVIALASPVLAAIRLSMLASMAHILSSGNPFKISNARVSSIQINVINLMPRWSRSEEGVSNQNVARPQSALGVLTEQYRRVAVHQARSHLMASRATTTGRQLSANPSEIRDLVDFIVADDRKPAFGGKLLRCKVGMHVEPPIPCAIPRAVATVPGYI